MGLKPDSFTKLTEQDVVLPLIFPCNVDLVSLNIVKTSISMLLILRTLIFFLSKA